MCSQQCSHIPIRLNSATQASYYRWLVWIVSLSSTSHFHIGLLFLSKNVWSSYITANRHLTPLTRDVHLISFNRSANILVFCMSCIWQLLNKRIYDDDDDAYVKQQLITNTTKVIFLCHVYLLEWLSKEKWCSQPNNDIHTIKHK